jgi:hypothetical protein
VVDEVVRGRGCCACCLDLDLDLDGDGDGFRDGWIDDSERIEHGCCSLCFAAAGCCSVEDLMVARRVTGLSRVLQEPPDVAHVEGKVSKESS